MDCDWSISRLPLHTLKLVNEVQDGVGLVRGCGLGPADEMELSYHSALLGLLIRECARRTIGINTMNNRDKTEYKMYRIQLCRGVVTPPTLSTGESLNLRVM